MNKVKFIKEIENQSQTEVTVLENKMTKLKNTLEGFNNRLDKVEEWICKVEDKVMELTKTEQQKENKNLIDEDNLRNLWENIKQNDICIIGIPKGKERKGQKTYLK